MKSPSTARSTFLTYRREPVHTFLRRKWKKGDVITFHLPMKVSLEQIPDKKDYYAFLYGPIVLATSTGTENLDGIYADDSRGGHIAHGRQTPLQEVPMLIRNPDSIRHSLHKLSGSKLAFSYDGNVYPAQKSKSLELIPFFRLHNSRYAVYFRQASEEQFKTIQEEMATAERKATELANRTVDLIFPVNSNRNLIIAFNMKLPKPEPTKTVISAGLKVGSAIT